MTRRNKTSNIGSQMGRTGTRDCKTARNLTNTRLKRTKTATAAKEPAQSRHTARRTKQRQRKPRNPSGVKSTMAVLILSPKAHGKATSSHFLIAFQRSLRSLLLKKPFDVQHADFGAARLFLKSRCERRIKFLRALINLESMRGLISAYFGVPVSNVALQFVKSLIKPGRPVGAAVFETLLQVHRFSVLAR